jgi:hypothetical protein
MTAKSAFSDEDWKTVLAGPPNAGMVVLTAQSGGTWSETWAMSKAYTEARQQHGESELLDEVVSAKPKMEHTSYRTPEELREGCLQRIRDAIGVLEGSATPQEIDDYKSFVVHLTHKVAAAHREDGEDATLAESDAIRAIAGTLGVPATD